MSFELLQLVVVRASFHLAEPWIIVSLCEAVPHAPSPIDVSPAFAGPDDKKTLSREEEPDQ